MKNIQLAFVCCIFLVFKGNAQIDTQFWFAVPEASSSHADRPVFLRLAADTLPSVVVISVPARNQTLATLNVNPGTTTSYDLTSVIDSLECRAPDLIRKWGLLITASRPITAYFEIARATNTDLFVLKGNNALGKKFFTPFQTRYNNTTAFNNECWSSADIVSAEDNNSVTITPSTDIIGHKKGIPYTVLLQRGETYSIRDSLKTKNVGNMSGTLIESAKNIAVTIKDDGVEIVDLVSNYRDIIGDQLQSVGSLGKEHIIVKGDLNPNDFAYLVGTENITSVSVGGVNYTLNAGQSLEVAISANTYILADKPIYLYHLTGSQFETASAIVPAINCTGSPKVTWSRANNTRAFIILVVPTSATGNFLLNGNAATITPASFTAVPNSPGWSAAKIDVTGSLPVGSNTLNNTKSVFHMAFLTGDNGSGGSAYGFFTNFRTEVNAGFDTTVCSGTEITLPDPGAYYTYQYSVISGDLNSIISKNKVKPTVTTTYLMERTGSCPASDTVVVFINDVKSNAGPDTTLCSGSLVINGKESGGFPPYTKLWSNGSTNSTVSLAAGLHWYEITDSKGCRWRDSVAVFYAPKFTINSGSATVKCKGENSGYAFVSSVTGSTSPYTFQWQNGSDNDSIQVPAGTYKVLVADRFGCVDSLNITVTEPIKLVLDTDLFNPSCAKINDGRIVAKATGGTSPYSYKLNQGVFTTQSTFSNLDSGTYTLYVRDKNNCLDSLIITLSDGSNPTVIAPADTSACQNSRLSFTGSGTSGLSFSWNNGISNSTLFTALNSGMYVVTGTLPNGCSNQDSVYLTVLKLPEITIQNPQFLCSDTGLIYLKATPMGGKWRGAGITDSLTGAFNSTTVSGFTKVYYTYTDVCTAVDSINLEVVPTPSAEIEPAGPFCLNAAPTQLVAANLGGIWTGNGVSSSGEFNPSQAGAGNHPIIYSLQGRCPDSDTLTISVSTSFDASIFPQNPLCVNSSQVILQSTTPGASWSGKGITNSLTGEFNPTVAGVGTHVITHSIAGSCGDTDQQSITVLALDSSRITAPKDSLCFGSGLLNLSATPSGTWSGPVNSSGAFDPMGKATGTYKIFYTSNLQCPHTDSLLLFVADSFYVESSQEDVKCFGESTGTINLNPINGVFPYTYSWLDSPAVSLSRTNLAAGNYQGTVTDGIGCVATTGIQISQAAALVFTPSELAATDDSCYNAGKGMVLFSPIGGTSQFGSYTFELTPAAGQAIVGGQGFRNLPSANYSATCTDDNGCIAVANFFISQPDSLIIYARVVSAEYCNQQNGSAAIDSILGGHGPYNILWENGSTNPVLTGISQGPQSVVITDKNLCQASRILTIPFIAAPDLDFEITSPTCFGFKDGIIKPLLTGGTPPFSYRWSDGSTLAIRNNQQAGNGSLEISDAAGCITESIYSVDEPTAVKTEPVSNDTICYQSTLVKSLSAEGGNGAPYTFFLNGSNSPPAASITSMGTYLVTCIDSKNCPGDTVEFTLAEPTPLNLFLSQPTPLCRFETVVLTPQVSGGKFGASKVFEWNGVTGFPQMSIVTNESTQSGEIYKVKVSDGCAQPDSVEINVLLHPDPSAAISISPMSGCFPLDVNYHVSGNLSTYTLFSQANSTPVINSTHRFQEPGNYQGHLIGKTQEGCADTLIFPRVIVSGYPDAEFAVSPTEITTLQPVIYLTSRHSASPLSYRWTVEDPDGKVQLSETHRFEYKNPAIKGLYKASLRVENQYGCADSSRQEFNSDEELLFYLPSVFTPDHDGNNEEYFAITAVTELNKYSFEIFDRWGELIFHSLEPGDGWDGTYKGHAVSNGTYMYRLVFRREGESEVSELTGKFSLLR